MIEVDFLSNEWAAVRMVVNDLIKNELQALEKAENEKDADKNRGGLRALRAVLALEKRGTHTQ